MRNKQRNYIFFIALMTAFSTSLYFLEMFLPKPMLFIKIGLSNIVVLVLVFSSLYKVAFFVAILKSIMGAFFTGLIFSPTFMLSFLGGVMASGFMVLFDHLLNNKNNSVSISIFGLSVVGAFVHLTTQLIVVRLFIIQSNSVFTLYPVIAVISVLTGVLTGLAGFYVLKYINIRKYHDEIVVL